MLRRDASAAILAARARVASLPVARREVLLARWEATAERARWQSLYVRPGS